VLPITPQGNARLFYHAPSGAVQGARGLLCAILVAAGCSVGAPREARWTVDAAGLHLEASGLPGERLLIFAGLATGPHVPRTNGRVWTTVPADPFGTTVRAVAEGGWTGAGAVRLTTPWSALPADEHLVVQALAYDDRRERGKAHAYPAVALRGRGADARIVPHARALLLGPRGLQLFGLGVAAAALVALRRSVRRAAGSRAARVVAVAAGLVALFALRAAAPESVAAPPWLPSFAPRPGAPDADFEALIAAAARAAAKGSAVPVAIAGRVRDGLADAAAVRAAARLRPLDVRLVAPETAASDFEPLIRFDDLPPPGGGAPLLRNATGGVWLRSAPASRRTESR
jgi:hypothetical protein